MAISVIQLNSREEWLEHRRNYIGGSEASCIVGMSPYITNVELWELKTGKRKAEDISDEPCVKYGTNAEKYLRELFALDHPEYKVEYMENNSVLNDKYPFAAASLDGFLEDEKGRKGILEIKTSTISRSEQSEKWRGRVPNNYYCQILHYMMVLEADFTILRAYIRYPYGSFNAAMNEYRVEREDVEGEIEYLEEKEREFWRYVENRQEPPLVLPEI